MRCILTHPCRLSRSKHLPVSPYHLSPGIPKADPPHAGPRPWDGLDNRPESGYTPASLSLCGRVAVPAQSLVESLALEEALGFVRGQLGASLPVRPGLHGNGYSEEQVSLWLLRYCRAEGMGYPGQGGCLNPVLSVPGSWLDLAAEEETLKLPFLLFGPLFFTLPSSLRARCSAGPSSPSHSPLHC